MAEFSKEFLEEKGWEDWEPDFSILEKFREMKEGELVHCICEGFGFWAIKKVNNTCLLIFYDKEVPIEELITVN